MFNVLILGLLALLQVVHFLLVSLFQIRNWSHIVTHFLFVLLLGVNSSKKQRAPLF